MSEALSLQITKTTENAVTLQWNAIADAESYTVFWADMNLPTTRFKTAGSIAASVCEFTFKRSTHVPLYFKVAAVASGKELCVSGVVHSPVVAHFNEQLETLKRGLIAVKANTGIFLSWRLFKSEVTGFSSTGLTGTNFAVLKNGEEIARVTDSTNYLDKNGTADDWYAVAPLSADGKVLEPDRKSVV